MPLNFRTYHDLTEADHSGLAGQIGAQRRRVAERMATVARVVAVMSGKGGVGKSFVTAQLARALARAGRPVGVLDADLNGPRPLAFRGPEAESFVWRGTLEAAALREFLADVAWGRLDVLLVDLPPGMQRFAELAELLPEPPPVVAVTIPTPQSEDAVRRALHAARERGAPCLGVIENMAGGPFAGDAGDALAREFGIPVLARVPFHPTDDVWDALVPKVESSR